jgi:hypothetical protein
LLFRQSFFVLFAALNFFPPFIGLIILFISVEPV